MPLEKTTIIGVVVAVVVVIVGVVLGFYFGLGGGGCDEAACEAAGSSCCGGSCLEKQYCCNGTPSDTRCDDACDPTCGPNQYCKNGTCVDDDASCSCLSVTGECCATTCCGATCLDDVSGVCDCDMVAPLSQFYSTAKCCKEGICGPTNERVCSEDCPTVFKNKDSTFCCSDGCCMNCKGDIHYGSDSDDLIPDGKRCSKYTNDNCTPSAHYEFDRKNVKYVQCHKHTTDGEDKKKDTKCEAVGDKCACYEEVYNGETTFDNHCCTVMAGTCTDNGNGCFRNSDCDGNCVGSYASSPDCLPDE